jgi:ankyrin repeat protein
MTPLHIAVEAGNSHMVEILFNVADDKNPAMTNGRTPLHIAAQFGDIDTIRLICPEVIIRILLIQYSTLKSDINLYL